MSVNEGHCIFREHAIMKYIRPFRGRILYNSFANQTMNKIAWWLVIIGALNWGLVGIGEFVGGNWNVVNLLLGSISSLEAIVYVLVGASAVVLLLDKKKMM